MGLALRFKLDGDFCKHVLALRVAGVVCQMLDSRVTQTVGHAKKSATTMTLHSCNNFDCKNLTCRFSCTGRCWSGLMLQALPAVDVI